MVRRHDDTDNEGALSRSARPVWRVLTLIASILAAGGSGLVAARAFAANAAGDVVAPVERKIDDHLSKMAGLQSVMAQYVDEERAARCASARNVFRLCMQARIECEPVGASCRGAR